MILCSLKRKVTRLATSSSQKIPEVTRLTSKESSMASSSIGWTTEASTSEGEPDILVMEVIRTDGVLPEVASRVSPTTTKEPAGISVAAVAEVVEATSPLGNTLIIYKQPFFDIIVPYYKEVLYVGVPPLDITKEPVSLPEGFREETSTSTTAAATELDVLYHNLPSYQLQPTGDSRVVKEMMAAEPIALPAEPVDETTVVSLTPPVLATLG